MIESLRLPVALVDANGAILFRNPAFSEATGEDQAPLESIADAFAEGDRKRVAQSVTRVAERKAANAVLDVALADGRWIQLSLTSAAASRDKGDVVALLQDISSQRDTENALNISSARLLALTEATPIAAMIENAAGEVELANEAFCRLLGLEAAPQSLTGVNAAETLARAKKAAKTLDRQFILMDEEPAGSMGLGKVPVAGSGGAKGAAEIGLIEKIAMELSVAMEGLSAVAIRAQAMDVDPQLVE